MDVLVGNTSINGGFSTATFDYWIVVCALFFLCLLFVWFYFVYLSPSGLRGYFDMSIFSKQIVSNVNTFVRTCAGNSTHMCIYI